MYPRRSGRPGRAELLRKSCYHVLPAMLLNEVQKQQRQLDTQASRQAEQDERLRDQTRPIDA